LLATWVLWIKQNKSCVNLIKEMPPRIHKSQKRKNNNTTSQKTSPERGGYRCLLRGGVKLRHWTELTYVCILQYCVCCLSEYIYVCELRSWCKHLLAYYSYCVCEHWLFITRHSFAALSNIVTVILWLSNSPKVVIHLDDRDRTWEIQCISKNVTPSPVFYAPPLYGGCKD